MKVVNINGISVKECKCGSWFEHWMRYGGLFPLYCSVYGCMGKDLVGAHVQRDSSEDSNWYIVPLCKKHSAEIGNSILISDSTALVPANISETCGKK